MRGLKAAPLRCSCPHETLACKPELASRGDPTLEACIHAPGPAIRWLSHQQAP